MSQKNMENMLRQEDKAEAEDFTAFLQSLNEKRWRRYGERAGA